MNQLSQFLEKIKNKIGATSLEREFVIGTLKEVLGIDILFSQIEIKNNIVYIKTNLTIKNEIFLKKPIILKKLNSFNGQTKFFDIR